VTVNDKVLVSLSTWDPEIAKTRFRLAEHALDQHFVALAEGLKPMTRMQPTPGPMATEWAAMPGTHSVGSSQKR
jgi:hypothetical protein